MTRRSDLFRPLEPPPGGLPLLRERLRRREVRAGWWLAVPAVAASCAALVVALRPAAPNPILAKLQGDPFAQALGLTARDQSQIAAGVVSVAPGSRAQTAVRQLASGNPNVVLYWVDSTAEAAPVR
ncbi:MAG: hypothetical protein HY901_20180 [Deltaproteobacteria bacterium]|nr:hypothetical protein [Deltaproteobacteria bacterium]